MLDRMFGPVTIPQPPAGVRKWWPLAAAIVGLVGGVWAVSAVYANFAAGSPLVANIVLSALGVAAVAVVWLTWPHSRVPEVPAGLRIDPVDLRLPAPDPQAVADAVRKRISAALLGKSAGVAAAMSSGNRGSVDLGSAATHVPPELRVAWAHLLWESGDREGALAILQSAADEGDTVAARRARALQRLIGIERKAREIESGKRGKV